jgi:hypothetical protein
MSLQKLPLGNGVAVPFPKNKLLEYNDFVRIPLLGALTTGITFQFLLTDDGTNAADLGKVAVMGVLVKLIATDTDTTDITTAGADAEVTANCTLNAATGIIQVVPVAVANAHLDSAAVSGVLMVRFRRVGDSASDTCRGRILCAGINAYAY